MAALINRSAFILYPKKPFFEWLARLDQEDAGLNQDEYELESTIYLVEDYDTDEAYTEFLETNYAHFFEFELSAWYEDSSVWPENRTLALFHEWFHASLSTIIMDTVDQAIEKDED